jgi:hypothetical protein
MGKIVFDVTKQRHCTFADGYMPLQRVSVRPPRSHAQNLSLSSGNLSGKIEVSSGKVLLER